MIIRRVMNTLFPNVPNPMSLSQLVDVVGMTTYSGQTVTEETSKSLSIAYRCINIISDDVAKMPLQTFEVMRPGNRLQVAPDARRQNLAWLLEVSPNRWMTPFVFKKTIISWLLTYGSAYVWQPPKAFSGRRELFILPSSSVTPGMDGNGQLWYRVIFSNGQVEVLPGVEVLSLIINSTDGLTGRSVLTYARESLGRQIGAYETLGKFYAQGLNPAGILWMDGDLSKENRDKVREKYEEAMSGSANAYRLAILDQKVSKFEPISMKPVDMQFLESIQQTDLEIANFFGLPLFKLNMGKQSYNSNEQANLDYLSTTLDPYLVQFEQAAMLKWLSEEEASRMYVRFNRDSLLRTDAQTRAAVIKSRIESGVLTPNEGRAIDDLSAFDGGDTHYLPANLSVIDPEGNLRGVGKGE